jgi:hypothetical protein
MDFSFVAALLAIGTLVTGVVRILFDASSAPFRPERLAQYLVWAVSPFSTIVGPLKYGETRMKVACVAVKGIAHVGTIGPTLLLNWPSAAETSWKTWKRSQKT